MPKGTVKWFNTTKGFGFIAPETGGADVFVHISAVEQSGLTGLADDMPIEYELIEGRDGRRHKWRLPTTARDASIPRASTAAVPRLPRRPRRRSRRCATASCRD